MNVDLAGLERAAVKNDGGGNRIEASDGLGRVDQENFSGGFHDSRDLPEDLLDGRDVFDGVERHHCIESAVFEIEIRRRHRPDPWNHGHVSGVRIQIDADFVDTQLAECSYQMNFAASEVDNALPWHRCHPVTDELEVARVPPIDQRILARVVASSHPSSLPGVWRASCRADSDCADSKWGGPDCCGPSCSDSRWIADE